VVIALAAVSIASAARAELGVVVAAPGQSLDVGEGAGGVVLRAERAV